MGDRPEPRPGLGNAPCDLKVKEETAAAVEGLHWGALRRGGERGGGLGGRGDKEERGSAVT